MTLLNAYIGDSISFTRHSSIKFSIALKVIERNLNKNIRKKTHARPDLSQLFRYAWFCDNTCFEQIQKLVHVQTSKLLN